MGSWHRRQPAGVAVGTPAHPVRRHLAVAGAATGLICGLAATTTVLSPPLPASGAVVIGGCAIVPNPTPVSNTSCPSSNLSGANLSGFNLSYANLSRANLSRANLSGANLTNANLMGANLSGSNLKNANLTSANLTGADLSGSNLKNANLSNANLTGANLTNANLTSARLGGAILLGANVTGANLNAFFAATVMPNGSINSAGSTITIAPTSSSVPNGLTQGFTATAHYSDGTSVTLADNLTWHSSDSAVAMVSPTGVAKGVVPNAPYSAANFPRIATISATAGAAVATASLSVVAPNLKSIGVTPVAPAVLVGGSQRFTATGTYTDASTQDVTATVGWSSVPTATATISPLGVATGVSAGTATIKASSGAISSASVTLIVTPTLGIATTSLPDGVLSSAYSQTLDATGGKPAYAWSITRGGLPSGLSLNGSTGVISGTPTTAGTSTFTVQVTDPGPPAQSVTEVLSINVGAALSITTASLPDAVQNSPYSQTVVVAGGQAPYGWSITHGGLPSGLNLNPSTGVISGTPTTVGASSFTVQARDSEIPAQFVTEALSIDVRSSSPVIVSGSISSDTTWSPQFASAYIIEGSVDVPAGITLTVAAGTVVKGFGREGCDHLGGGALAQSSCSLSVEGTLQVMGTAGDMATFTSLNDNSVGGATGTGSPAPGDWGGISGSGSFDINYAEIEYAYAPLTIHTSSSVNVVGDRFDHDSYGLDLNAPTPTIQNNEATNIGSPPGGGTDYYAAYSIHSDNLDLDKITGNMASGGEPVLALSGTVMTSSTMQPNQAPFAIGGGYITGTLDNNISIAGVLDVPTGITLTVAAGTVVKGFGREGCDHLGGGALAQSSCSLSVEGTLQVMGTAGDMATFTSLNDSPAPGDWGGISGSGSFDINYAEIEYAYAPLTIHTSSSVNVVGDRFDHDSYGLDLNAPTPTIQNNEATNIGSPPGGGTDYYAAYSIHSDNLDLDKITGNMASGGEPVLALSGTVMTSSTMQPNQAPFAIGGGYITGTLDNNISIAGVLDVPTGITLTVAAGTVVKGFGREGCDHLGGGALAQSSCSLSVEGTLQVMGTAGDMATFTSLNDNSVGGATGTGSPAPGDWGGISGSGSFDINYAEIEYAVRALDYPHELVGQRRWRPVRP